MQSKTLALFALSASAAIASPFNKRAELQHHRFHGTGSGAFRPTGTGKDFPAGNDTEGAFAPTGSGVLTMTVSPLPVNAATDAAASSCVGTDIATVTSTNLVTVTARGADVANNKASQAGNGRTRGGGNWGQSSAAPATQSDPMPSSNAASAANPSTTFASVPSASKSSGASASAATSAATSATASSIVPASGSASGKRGISYNDASLVSAFGSSVSWAYNWGATAAGSIGVEFVPMMWGRNEVSSFADQVGSATHVLSFNEPDLGAQANIDAATAVQLHKQGMASLVGKVQIGSPAVTNGGGDMGVTWLDNFFKACGGSCNCDFVAYHWYDSAENFAYFQKHTDDVVAVAAKYGIQKVWLTEFQPSGSADAQASFMKQAVEYLDGNPAVERYAAFMAAEGALLTGNSLNTLGSAYAS
ncbi:hypothetical protein LTR70_003699 [Exophiala xenobiotica]|uniref:Asl1-like glycosyl hydrolase catalytic domain-containing protein n=1 Tax=Lithohypha guttulata TaxID=1690604 RepID=A0ABR0KI63_9EURO|nr:hypothetical protein LTR24_002340 [Lithohypha guttulata]KAK5322751.1 hypothetical protein LTR70_003699 [Exophiala xenobiotica]